MSTCSATSTLSTTMPAGFWMLTSRLPISSLANAPALAASLKSLTPPAFPRPPISTWAFTTTLPPSLAAISSTTSGSDVTSPAGTGTPNLARRSFDWYSWSFKEAKAYRTTGRLRAVGQAQRHARQVHLIRERVSDPAVRLGGQIPPQHRQHLARVDVP